MNAELDGDLGARVEDVAQEAIDAAATTYSNDAHVEVEHLLRAELSSRGIKGVDQEWVAEVAQSIRAGDRARVGRSDGSRDSPDHV